MVKPAKTIKELPARIPQLKVHLWLEGHDGVFFGPGRVELLQSIARCGSLSKAAEELGMSYRAAWGKIKNSEKNLGFPLLASRGSKKEGYTLTPEAVDLMTHFLRWYAAVEEAALELAQKHLPVDITYIPKHKEQIS